MKSFNNEIINHNNYLAEDHFLEQIEHIIFSKVDKDVVSFIKTNLGYNEVTSKFYSVRLKIYWETFLIVDPSYFLKILGG